MYLISNKERREILRLLAMLRIWNKDHNTRRANMARVAGLLIGKLESKKEIPNDQVREMCRRLSED